jgi:hypothetical protein
MTHNAETARLGALAGAIVRTEEFGEILGAALPGVIERWAGKNPVKRFLAKPVGRSVRKSFAPGAEGGMKLERLFADPEFVGSLSEILPGMVNAALAGAETFAAELADMSPDARAQAAGALVGAIDAGRAGRALTSMLRALNGLHAHEPSFVTERSRPLVRALIREIDFGELKEAVENSAADAAAFAAMVNEELWEYPAKVVCLLSLIPALVNTGMRAAVATLAPVNRMAPDLLADVMLSILRELDGARAGELVNELCEALRKLRTGSALIGEKGNPQLPLELERMVRAVAGTVDAGLLFKAGDTLREIGESLAGALADEVRERPDLALGMLRARFRSAAAGARMRTRFLENAGSALSDREIAGALEAGLGELDLPAWAAGVNALCDLLGRARESASGAFANALEAFSGSLDRERVAETAARLVCDLTAVLRPLAPEVMPGIIEGIAELVQEARESRPGETDRALGKLRAALTGGR